MLVAKFIWKNKSIPEFLDSRPASFSKGKEKSSKVGAAGMQIQGLIYVTQPGEVIVRGVNSIHGSIPSKNQLGDLCMAENTR